MREVGVLQAKTHLSDLLAQVERDGAEIIITRHGRPIARLGPHTPVSWPRRLSGPELLARTVALQERIAERSPSSNDLTWGELKDLGQT